MSTRKTAKKRGGAKTGGQSDRKKPEIRVSDHDAVILYEMREFEHFKWVQSLLGDTFTFFPSYCYVVGSLEGGMLLSLAWEVRQEQCVDREAGYPERPEQWFEWDPSTLVQWRMLTQARLDELLDLFVAQGYLLRRRGRSDQDGEPCWFWSLDMALLADKLPDAINERAWLDLEGLRKRNGISSGKPKEFFTSRPEGSVITEEFIRSLGDNGLYRTLEQKGLLP